MKTSVQRLLIMYSRFEHYSVSLELHVLSSISNDMPSRFIRLDQSKIPYSINEQLADPSYNTPGRIDVLLGAETFYTLFSGERVRVSESLMFHKTKLGWILTGKVLNNDVKHCKLVTCNCTHDTSNSSALSLFACKSSTRKIEEDEAEQHFKSTHFRNDSG
ncbi:uncharacterized protein LOC111042408 [Myzus persicae]|uniref:uncharacterized protein LOC111042408 n=1 Tax=Myzus persicae TaxID=13164 RepID=UPI000B931600|nr:uncharacterized protein LOC111042408 [Myzus persicae]